MKLHPAAKELIQRMRELIDSAIDTHIYDHEDEIPDDCPYIQAVRDADAILGVPIVFRRSSETFPTYVQVDYRTPAGNPATWTAWCSESDLSRANAAARDHVRAFARCAKIDTGSAFPRKTR